MISRLCNVCVRVRWVSARNYAAHTQFTADAADVNNYNSSISCSSGPFLCPSMSGSASARDTIVVRSRARALARAQQPQVRASQK